METTKKTVPVLLDTTLRNGEQSAGLYFTHDQKIRIGHLLDGLGIGIVEAGIPAMGEEECAVLRELAGSLGRSQVLAWGRLTPEDVKWCLRAGVGRVHVSVPTSPQLLRRKVGKDRDWVLDRMEAVVGFARAEGLEVSLGAEDASRTDLDFLRSVFRHAQSLGCCRVRYADTLGVLTPLETSAAIGALAAGLDIPIDFHAHNDMGMATANAYCAWRAGARVLSCSLLGLGERAGNTALEEIAAALRIADGLSPEFDLNLVGAVCRELAETVGRPLDERKPFFGSRIFAHESGIHVDGLLKSAETYEAYPPALVGGSRELVLGKHSGRASLKHFAALACQRLDDAEAQAFIDELRRRMAGEPGVDAKALFTDYLVRRRAARRAEARS